MKLEIENKKVTEKYSWPHKSAHIHDMSATKSKFVNIDQLSDVSGPISEPNFDNQESETGGEKEVEIYMHEANAEFEDSILSVMKHISRIKNILKDLQAKLVEKEDDWITELPWVNFKSKEVVNEIIWSFIDSIKDDYNQEIKRYMISMTWKDQEI